MMTSDQDQLIHDLLQWADKCGNWQFCRDLGSYVDFLKQREAKPQQVSALEIGLRGDYQTGEL